MIEAKNFIFLSRTQRLAVSSRLCVFLVLSIGLIYASKTWATDEQLKLLGMDLLKMGSQRWPCGS